MVTHHITTCLLPLWPRPFGLDVKVVTCLACATVSLIAQHF